jgi:hypothetical protein
MDEGEHINGINNNEATTYIEMAYIAKKCHQSIEKLKKPLQRFELSHSEWRKMLEKIADSY